MTDSQPCPICKHPAQVTDDGRLIVICPRCGNYKIESSACDKLKDFTPSQIANLSGWVRASHDCSLADKDLDRLRGMRTPSVGEKAEKILLYLSQQNPKVSAIFSIFAPDFDELNGRLLDWDSAELSRFIQPEYLARSWAEDYEELAFLLETYLEGRLGYLATSTKDGHGYFQITPEGWTHVDSLRSVNPESQTGFIAMWFDKSVDPAYLVIDAGIRDAGYEPLRIDKKEHNNKIDDEIVAAIRRSKFLVADFTGHRGGVYFEAGLATGLALPVIWLCRKDDLEKIHFDTRQYNCILWDADNLDGLKKAVQHRIEATIGRGPLRPEGTAGN